MKGALIVLDGWGLRSDSESDGSTGRDAIANAHTPVFDRIRRDGASGTLEVSGRRVGLPDGQMGNSEVGHLNIGAGRVVDQEYTRITDAIADGSFRENDVLASAFDHVTDTGGRVHFLGLVSDGGVHSDHSHLHELIRFAADRDVQAITHAITDGRDTSPRSGIEFLETLESVAERHGTGDVATVSGRYYAMDRDENWERTKRAYDAIVHRDCTFDEPSATAAINASYDRGQTDEFVEPTCIDGGPPLTDGDAVVWFNFRSDRARQLTRMLADIRPKWSFETTPPAVPIVTMTEFDETFDLPVAFPPSQPTQVLGEVLADASMTQLRIAESEKYAHVTYFLNGGREVAFDGETREIVDSPSVPTYDERPDMSAETVTDVAIAYSRGDRPTVSGDRPDEQGGGHTDGCPDVLIVNYANPDMVGHTGNYRAAVQAVEAVDTQLGRLVDALQEAGAHVIVTADHGNADDMGTEADPHTAHTANDVPFVYLTPDGSDGGRTIRPGGTLADVAPTLLDVLDIDQPAVMTGETLVE